MNKLRPIGKSLGFKYSIGQYFFILYVLSVIELLGFLEHHILVLLFIWFTSQLVCIDLRSEVGVSEKCQKSQPT